ncbi:hypothetical protein N657DRAFT_15846 [Parathielavia appendiculata]|uniref:Uncharacterized protein n=1 Tax=Parathielavia appendiculata TaxID=2587402 RepID=A0AAN6U8D8_9PEZI|nr:hypothetical protein N657DRAFT_15846 [Parathielavia appendiculata]
MARCCAQRRMTKLPKAAACGQRPPERLSLQPQRPPGPTALSSSRMTQLPRERENSQSVRPPRSGGRIVCSFFVDASLCAVQLVPLEWNAHRSSHHSGSGQCC